MSEGKPGNGTNGSSPGKTKERSPSYPAINLKVAIDRAQQFYQHERRNSAPAAIVAQHWGFAEKSSGGRRTLSSLVDFGLLEESGRGVDRRVKLSRLALDILLDERPDSAERQAAIKQAALNPSIHARLWKEWGADIPSEANVRTFLKKDLEFTDSAVPDLIREYKDTVEFAKLDSTDTIPAERDDEEPVLPPSSPKVSPGDLVEHRRPGTLMFFPEHRKVLSLSADGDWAFLEGSNDGVPTNELRVVKTQTELEAAKPKVPPPNPHYRPPPPGKSEGGEPRDEAEWGVPPLRFPLPRGNVIEIRLKSKVNAAEFKKIKKIFDLSAFAFLEDADAEEMMGDEDGSAK